MAKANPTIPDAPSSEERLHDRVALPDTRPTPKDPRTVSAVDNLGDDRPGDLLSAELDDEPGDDAWGRNFADDVRSDSYDDERHERR